MKLSIGCTKLEQGGGSERYVLDVIRGFSDIQQKLTVYAMEFDQTLPEYQNIIPQIIPFKIIPKLLRLSFLSYFINKNKSKDELLTSMQNICADIRFCGGQHRGYLSAKNKNPNLKDKFKIYLEEKSFNHAKKIIAHSKLMKKELIQFYNIPEDKIEVIYPPVDTRKFTIISDNERKKLREELGFNDNEIFYLFPSTGHKRKGFDKLKSFFANTVLPIKLVVAGTPVKESKNIISLGFRRDMPKLYQAADFTIMASEYEPFGLVGIESILSGTPIVFSKNMACLEVFDHDYPLVFDRNDKYSLENVILHSINLVKENKSRIENPLEIIHYNPELDEHIQLLQKVISDIKLNN